MTYTCFYVCVPMWHRIDCTVTCCTAVALPIQPMTPLLLTCRSLTAPARATKQNLVNKLAYLYPYCCNQNNVSSSPAPNRQNQNMPPLVHSKKVAGAKRGVAPLSPKDVLQMKNGGGQAVKRKAVLSVVHVSTAKKWQERNVVLRHLALKMSCRRQSGKTDR